MSKVFGKYAVVGAIEHLEERFTELDATDKAAIQCLIWNYKTDDEMNRQMSETLKERELEIYELHRFFEEEDDKLENEMIDEYRTKRSLQAKRQRNA